MATLQLNCMIIKNSEMKTTLKINNKLEYYTLWKGIRSLLTIISPNKTDISILDSNGKLITDPLKIVNCFNEYFVNVGSTAENKIPHTGWPLNLWFKFQLFSLNNDHFPAFFI